MSLRAWLKRLERSSSEEFVSIPQKDGSAAHFPPDELKEAFLVNQRRLQGEDVPPHPLTVAAANSSEAKWRDSFFSEMTIVVGAEIEDLSEG